MNLLSTLALLLENTRDSKHHSTARPIILPPSTDDLIVFEQFMRGNHPNSKRHEQNTWVQKSGSLAGQHLPIWWLASFLLLHSIVASSSRCGIHSIAEIVNLQNLTRMKWKTSQRLFLFNYQIQLIFHSRPVLQSQSKRKIYVACDKAFLVEVTWPPLLQLFSQHTPRPALLQTPYSTHYLLRFVWLSMTLLLQTTHHVKGSDASYIVQWSSSGK